MRQSRTHREKNIVILIAVIATFALFITFFTLLININSNKGTIPLIFLFLTIFYISLLIYNLFFINLENKTVKNHFKTMYLFLAILSFVMFMLSFITLWK